MSSKKKRKHLKETYQKQNKVKNLPGNFLYKEYSQPVLNYLKDNKYKYVTGKEICTNTNYTGGLSNISSIIKGLIYYDNEPILTKKGRGAGYMYYG